MRYCTHKTHSEGGNYWAKQYGHLWIWAALSFDFPVAFHRPAVPWLIQPRPPPQRLPFCSLPSLLCCRGEKTPCSQPRSPRPGCVPVVVVPQTGFPGEMFCLDYTLFHNFLKWSLSGFHGRERLRGTAGWKNSARPQGRNMPGPSRTVGRLRGQEGGQEDGNPEGEVGVWRGRREGAEIAVRGRLR